MTKLQLSEADRKRLGAPEFLPFDIDSMTNREAIALRKRGYNTPRVFFEALRVKEIKNDEGERIDLDVDPEAWTVMLWLALRRAGIETDVETLEFDLENLRSLKDEEPPPPAEDPGKAPDPDPSTSSETTS